MKDFMVRANFTCKNLLNKEVSFTTGDYVDELGGYLYKNGIPFCLQTSQLARDYLIWAGDGHELARADYEEIILFSSRVKMWDVEVPIYNKDGEVIGHETRKRIGRFLPSEMDYMKEHFPDLMESDSFMFNNFFYKGSDILEIKELAEYLSR